MYLAILKDCRILFGDGPFAYNAYFYNAFMHFPQSIKNRRY